MYKYLNSSWNLLCYLTMLVPVIFHKLALIKISVWVMNVNLIMNPFFFLLFLILSSLVCSFSRKSWIREGVNARIQSSKLFLYVSQFKLLNDAEWLEICKAMYLYLTRLFLIHSFMLKKKVQRGRNQSGSIHL